MENSKISEVQIPDYPEELLKQAEEATKVLKAMADEATNAMEEYLRGSYDENNSSN